MSKIGDHARQQGIPAEFLAAFTEVRHKAVNLVDEFEEEIIKQDARINVVLYACAILWIDGVSAIEEEHPSVPEGAPFPLEEHMDKFMGMVSFELMQREDEEKEHRH